MVGPRAFGRFFFFSQTDARKSSAALTGSFVRYGRRVQMLPSAIGREEMGLRDPPLNSGCFGYLA